MDEGLSLLKEEIETFNPDFKLLKKSIWLSSQNKKQINKHASILIAVENAKQAQLVIEKRLYIAGNYLIAEKCKENIVHKQCQNCLKYKHSTRTCFAQSICLIYAEMHKTFEHKCNICNTQGQACPHTTLKCSNCGENHMANSKICAYYNAEKRSYRHAQNLQKTQQQEQQQQNNSSSSNSFHVLIDNTTRQW